MVSRVLLPDPLGPTTATSPPASTFRSTVRRAWTSVLPSPYTFDTPRSSSVVMAVPPLCVAPAPADRPAQRAALPGLVSSGRRRRPATEQPGPAGTAPRPRPAPDQPRAQRRLPSGESIAASTPPR